MCSYINERADIMGHGKGVADWLSLTEVNVYFDHPVSAPLDHAVIIDFTNPAGGTGARVAVELSAESARKLVASIEAAVAAGEAEHAFAPA